MEFKRNSGIFTLTAVQDLPISIDEAWNFFKSPVNLAKITPDKMGFHITSELPEEMYAGLIITYKVGIFPLLKSNWVTEITQIQDRKHFIDEQRFGPYSMWHHVHLFEKIPGGVRMTDIISYKLPFSLFTNPFHNLFIKPQLKGIFAHRFKILIDLFGEIK